MMTASHRACLTGRLGKLSLAAAVALTPAFSSIAEEEADSEEPVVEATVGYFPLEVEPAEYLDRIQLPEGFEISIYRDGLEAARSMAMSDSCTLFLGTRSNRSRDKVGKVYAVTNPDGDARGDEVKVVVEGFNVPNGVALKDGDLYVAGGVEHMTRAPYAMSKSAAPFGRDARLYDTSLGWRFVNPAMEL